MWSVRRSPFSGSQHPQHKEISELSNLLSAFTCCSYPPDVGLGLMPPVGRTSSREGTRLQAWLYQPLMPSPRVGQAVCLLNQKQNLGALGLARKMPG